MALVRASLAAGRLVTLVGPGGVGKTRLAQEVADGHDPVWWVDLAPLRDPGAVAYAVAAVVGIELLPGGVLVDALGHWAGRARGLLVLDNCEHLLATVAGLAEELARRLLRPSGAGHQPRTAGRPRGAGRGRATAGGPGS